MANHKSAIKRARQNKIRQARNRAAKTRIKTVVKDIRSSLAAPESEAVDEKLKQATSIIHKAAKKGVIHHNTAARKISRLTKAVNTSDA